MSDDPLKQLEAGKGGRKKTNSRSYTLVVHQSRSRNESVYKLFEDPYSGEAPRRCSIATSPDGRRLSAQGHQFVKHGRTISLVLPSVEEAQTMGATLGRKLQTENLRKHVLYEGDYRVLNFALIAIISITIVGIIFVSVWHEAIDYNKNWPLFVALGIFVTLVSGVIGYVKLYFWSKRFGVGYRCDHLIRRTRRKTTDKRGDKIKEQQKEAKKQSKETKKQGSKSKDLMTNPIFEGEDIEMA